jgi:ankyrin repeat protein
MTNGADAKAKAGDGSNAVFLAAGSKKLDAVKMLVEMGIDVNEAPRGRGGALHTAIRSGSNDIVQYLAGHGADFNAKDQFGRNPLEEALFEAPKSTIELMQKLTADRAK